MAQPVVIRAAVEGDVDEAVARRLICEAGGIPGAVSGKRGKDALRKRIKGYANAAKYEPWLVLVDLNHEEDCPPPLRESWLTEVPPRLCFRIAVREVEAWLIADAGSLAKYLHVPQDRVPSNPETLRHPKKEVVNLARRSARKKIRLDMVPREGSGRVVGPAYNSRMIVFAASYWNPRKAARRSESLLRALRCLERLVRETSLQ